ncbi:unnamed protein product [Blepharisma stoltei]|uniref:F-box domain-containing protein n=1 Tax=Blepharisma stoltei TaxID=1481888 RepID=A0AAU9K496_9CILI|nr:unnamed protein product [Blepharisma stoltei]
MAYLSIEKFRQTRSIIQGISLIKREENDTCEYCYQCNEAINDDIMIQIGVKLIFQIETRTFHVKCVNPVDFKMLIPLTIPQEIYDTEIIQWIQNWNSSLNSTHLEQMTINKALQGKIRTNLRRPWLEVFKFLNYKEVLWAISLVNKEFYEICWSDEIWCFFMYRDFGEKCQLKSLVREEYFQAIYMRCHICHEKSYELIYRCHVKKRPVCQKCILTNQKEIMWSDAKSAFSEERLKMFWSWKGGIHQAAYLDFDVYPRAVVDEIHERLINSGEAYLANCFSDIAKNYERRNLLTSIIIKESKNIIKCLKENKQINSLAVDMIKSTRININRINDN